MGKRHVKRYLWVIEQRPIRYNSSAEILELLSWAPVAAHRVRSDARIDANNFYENGLPTRIVKYEPAK
jgi:hypothetical protein